MPNRNLELTSFNTQMCFCDDYEFPQNCSLCKLNERQHCLRLTPIMCSSIGCSKTFHKSCLASHGFVEGGKVDSNSHQIEYYCLECRCTFESSINHVPWDLIQMQHSLHELEIIIQKGHHLGFLGPSDVNEAPMEVTKCNILNMKNAISKCNLTTIIQPFT
jgi:hypothetical protein